MPGNTNMSIRVDSELKSQAEKILSQFGMNMTGAVNMFLQQIVRERFRSLYLWTPAAPYMPTCFPLRRIGCRAMLDAAPRKCLRICEY